VATATGTRQHSLEGILGQATQGAFKAKRFARYTLKYTVKKADSRLQKMNIRLVVGINPNGKKELLEVQNEFLTFVLLLSVVLAVLVPLEILFGVTSDFAVGLIISYVCLGIGSLSSLLAGLKFGLTGYILGFVGGVVIGLVVLVLIAFLAISGFVLSKR